MVAWALAEAGARKEASDAVTEARASADVLGNQAERAMALAMVEGARLVAGQLAEARSDFAEALAGARNIDDPESRSLALSVLAVIVARIGQADEAAKVRADAREAAKRIEDPFRRDRALQVVGLAQPGAGVSVASRTRGDADAGGTDEEPDLPGDTRGAADELSLKDRAQLRALMRDRQQMFNLEDALTEGGTPEEIARRAAEAYALVNTIRYPLDRVEFLTKIGGALSRAGRRNEALVRLEEARAVSTSIADPFARSIALAAIGSALADADQPDRAGAVLSDALAAARQVQELDGRSRALLRLLVVFDSSEGTAHAQSMQQAANELVKTVHDLVKLGTMDRGERQTAAVALARLHRYREARAMVAGGEIEDHLQVYVNVLASYGRRRHPELAGRLDRINRDRDFPRPDSAEDLESFYEYLEFASPRERWADR